jgi:hypothetical protein
MFGTFNPEDDHEEKWVKTSVDCLKETDRSDFFVRRDRTPILDRMHLKTLGVKIDPRTLILKERQIVE